MGSMADLSRIIIVVLNIFFMIVVLVVMGFGFIATFASDIQSIKTIDETIKEQLNDIVDSTGGSNESIKDFSIAKLLDGVGLIFILTGCLLLPFTIFGCCGACYKFKTLIYGFIVSFFLFLEVILVIVVYGAPGTIQEKIKESLPYTLISFQGALGVDLASLGWMFVMKQLECCGIDSYKDFEAYATWWDTTPNNQPRIDAPLACCRTNPEDSNMNCAREATFDIYTKGCFDAVWDASFGNPLLAGFGYGVAFLFQLLLIIFSIIMYRDMKKDKRNKIYPFYE